MQRAVVIVLLATAVAVGVLSATSAAQTQSSGEEGRSGRDIWLGDCAVCHGSRGEGTDRGPDITDVGTGGIDFMVRSGRMPIRDPDDRSERSAPAYADEEIEALLAYAATVVHGPGVPAVDLDGADVAAGGEAYRLNCSACHQMAGQGGALAYGDRAPPLTPVLPVQTVEAMRLGPGNMPVFAPDQFPDEVADDIAAYVEELHDPDDAGGWSIGHFGPVPEGAVAFAFGMLPILVLARLLGERDEPAAGEDP